MAIHMTMEALEVYLKANPGLFFNEVDPDDIPELDPNDKIEDLEQKQAECGQQMKNIQDAADAEKRRLNEEEEEEINKLFALFKGLPL